MNFNEMQINLWNDMITIINSYRNDEIKYTSLVYGLESAVDASEIIDTNIIVQWYDLWTSSRASISEERVVLVCK